MGEGRIILQSAIKKRQAATQIINLKVGKYENMNVNINLTAGIMLASHRWIELIHERLCHNDKESGLCTVAHGFNITIQDPEAGGSL